MGKTKEDNIAKVNNLDLELDMLWYINELLEFIEDKDITFREALLENMIQFEDEYCKVAYESIESLYKDGYIEGDVSIVYEGDITGVDEDYNKIEYGMCEFEDIKVTLKGKEALNKSKTAIKLKDAMKEIKKSLMRGGKIMAKEGEKAIPVMFTNIAVGLFSGYKGEMYKISIQKSKVRRTFMIKGQKD